MPAQPNTITRLQVVRELARGTPVENICNHFSISRATAYRYQAIFNQDQRIRRKKRAGEPILDESKLQLIEDYIKRNPFAKLSAIKNDLNLPVSICTISRACKKLGLPSRTQPKKFALSDINREIRIDFARRRCLFTQEMWNRIVFTDESGLDNSGTVYKRVRRPLGTRYDNNYIQPFRNKSLRSNFFSYISYHGVGTITFHTTMDSQLYCQRITEMIEDLKRKFNGQDFFVIHDNARFATSKQTVEYLKNNNLNHYFLKHPAYSPDMNIIENAWSYLKNKTKQRLETMSEPRKREEFEELIKHQWESIPVHIIENLYKSLPNRVKTIVEKDGYLTRY